MEKFELPDLPEEESVRPKTESGKFTKRIKTGVALAAAAVAAAIGVNQGEKMMMGDNEDTHSENKHEGSISFGDESVRQAYSDSLMSYHRNINESGHLSKGDAGYRETMARAVQIALKHGMPIVLERASTPDTSKNGKTSFETGVRTRIEFNVSNGVPVDIKVTDRGEERVVPFWIDDYDSAELKILRPGYASGVEF